jgi:hypothetical protein
MADIDLEPAVERRADELVDLAATVDEAAGMAGEGSLPAAVKPRALRSTAPR